MSGVLHASLGVQSPNQLGLSWVEFFDDFIGSSVAAAVDVSVWDFDVGTGATVTLPDTGTSGEVLFAGSATTSVGSIQPNGSTFKLATNKRLIFEARCKVEDVTSDTDVLFGMCETSAAPLASAAPLDGDFTGFIKVGASADIDVISQTDSTTTTETLTSVSTFSADTYRVFRLEWDGIDKVRFFVDGVKVAEQSTYIPTALGMKPTFAAQTNHTAGCNFTVDYVYCAAER